MELGESRKWLILAAAAWLQASTGTNFDFSAYSSTFKSVLGISQVQLNYLSVASDAGKVFGWCSGICLHYLPLWAVMFIAAFLGLFGYGLQWLLISHVISMPYLLNKKRIDVQKTALILGWKVFLLCLLAGCSICWFNTVCFVLCIRNFSAHRSVALALTISYNSLTAGLYTLLANAVNPESDTIYLFLNAFVPLFISCLVLIPILFQPPLQPPSNEANYQESVNFVILFIFAVMTGLYLLLLNPLSSTASKARILLAGACLLFILPLCFPGIICGIDWANQNIHARLRSDCPIFSVFSHEDIKLQDQFNDNDYKNHSFCSQGKNGFLSKVIEKDILRKIGDEHPVTLLVRRWDFWLYYLTYLCGGTIGLVYSNNLGQIAQSLGYYSDLSSIVKLYSTCSFFGRLLSAAPEFLQNKFARTGWLAVALVPSTIAFFLLYASGSLIALQTGTGMIGLSSGFIFSLAVSITSELFGYNSMSVNHNILITNIPIGSLLYGLLAALVYDSNADGSLQEELHGEMVACMGRKCYADTFKYWGCISFVGFISSLLLFLRTQPAYHHQSERNQSERQLTF